MSSPAYADDWIVVPAFNEAPMIGAVVQGLRAVFPNVIVVDDGSFDATADVARTAGAAVLRHPFNLGQGAALQTGIDYALQMNARRIVTFDADGQHSVEDAARVLGELDLTGVDVALGSRFLGRADGISRSRRVILRLATIVQRRITGLALTDAHNGLRAFTCKGAQTFRIKQNRMAHASEIIFKIAQHRLSFVEVPCTITYSDYSVGKGQTIAGAVQIMIDLFMWRLYK